MDTNVFANRNNDVYNFIMMYIMLFILLYCSQRFGMVRKELCEAKKCLWFVFVQNLKQSTLTTIHPT